MKKNDIENECLQVPQSAVKRLPRYYRFLRELISNDTMRISSSELAIIMGVTASQIRQDLSCFGAFGQQGYGYNVKYLYGKIGEILGLGDDFSAIIIGEKDLALHISEESIFARHGIALRGVLPDDAKKVLEYCSKNKVDIAVITSPAELAEQFVHPLEQSGVRGIWNLSGRELKSEKIKIVNVNISDSLMTLCYVMKKEMSDEC